MKSSKAQVKLYAIMVAVTIIVLALALAFPVSNASERARNETSGDVIGLNCSTTTDNFIKATCIFQDITPFILLEY